jgi:hypothetical protein
MKHISQRVDGRGKDRGSWGKTRGCGVACLLMLLDHAKSQGWLPAGYRRPRWQALADRLWGRVPPLEKGCPDEGQGAYLRDIVRYLADEGITFLTTGSDFQAARRRLRSRPRILLEDLASRTALGPVMSGTRLHWYVFYLENGSLRCHNPVRLPGRCDASPTTIREPLVPGSIQLLPCWPVHLLRLTGQGK